MNAQQMVAAFLGVLLIIIATAENWKPEAHALVTRSVT